MDYEAFEKVKLIKEALLIVDKLSKSDLADVDGEITDNDFDRDQLTKLILRAKTLTKNKLWKLS